MQFFKRILYILTLFFKQMCQISADASDESNTKVVIVAIRMTFIAKTKILPFYHFNRLQCIPLFSPSIVILSLLIKHTL